MEKPMRDLLEAANNDAERYRTDYNRASRELVVVRAELDQLRTEHCRSVAELKMRLETEVGVRLVVRGFILFKGKVYLSVRLATSKTTISASNTSNAKKFHASWVG